jgi:hypothetical protein
MNKYTFPFNSCEIPNENSVSQPYSTSINVILCLLILYYLSKSNNFYSQLFLFSLLLLNTFHTFSHFTHIESEYHIQFLLTHFSAIFGSLCLLLLLQNITGRSLDLYYIYVLSLLYFIDVVLIMYDVSHIYNIILFIIILCMIMILYYPYTPTIVKTNIKYIIGLTLITLFFMIIEVQYCKKMLEFIPGFPFHSIVELSAFFPITLLCKTFYKI